MLPRLSAIPYIIAHPADRTNPNSCLHTRAIKKAAIPTTTRDRGPQISARPGNFGLGDDPQPRRLHLVGRLAARLLFQTWIRILAPTTAMPTALVPPEPPATTTRVQPSRAARFRKTNLLPSNPSQSIALRR